ncbi:MAG: hypothetical protein ABSE48_18500 [Verrucomicrobiota bacterium]|jgi:hypothetical protein
MPDFFQSASARGQAGNVPAPQAGVFFADWSFFLQTPLADWQDRRQVVHLGFDAAVLEG